MTYREKLVREMTRQRVWHRENCDYWADIALRSIAAIAEDTGVKLVAREPTEEMGMAPKDRDAAKESDIYAGIWRSMHDDARRQALEEAAAIADTFDRLGIKQYRLGVHIRALMDQEPQG